jgi:DNA-binding helix-hairpin-helix protein with protein kinase domain
MSIIAEEDVLLANPVKIGSGGESIVYDLPGFRLPGLNFGLVYKQYRVPRQAVLGIRSLVARRDAQPPHVREVLDRSTVWPLRVVERDDNATGVLMRIIPSAFLHSVFSPSGRQLLTARETQFLMVPDSRITRLRMHPPTVAERLAVCADFGKVLSVLHGMGVVAGDINARNALFTLRDEPRVLLIDCDGYRMVGTSADRKSVV